MQARLGRHVTEILREFPLADPGWTRAESPSESLRNACYCVYCFDGGDLLLCDHCPAACHGPCAGVQDVDIAGDEHYYCPPCLKHHVGVLVSKVEELTKDSVKARKLLTELKRIIIRSSFPSRRVFFNELDSIALKVT